MKLVSYSYNNEDSYGLLTDNGIIDIRSNITEPEFPQTVKDALAAGTDFLDKIAGLEKTVTSFLDPATVTLLPPITQPGKLLALAGNYVKHIIEGGAKLGLSESPRETTVPRPFIMPNTALASPSATINLPCYSKQVDYEVELVIVIGKTAKCVTPEEAADHIAGYTIANDISARSVTFKENRAIRPWDEFFDWLNGKWADGFFPVGPCMVTADEIGDPQDLAIELKVNGQTRQKANTADMIFTAADIVSFLSHIMTLKPGDCIATGTPEGVGAASDTYLQPEDNIECTIEKIGTLTNKIGQGPDHLFKPVKA